MTVSAKRAMITTGKDNAIFASSTKNIYKTPNKYKIQHLFKIT